MGWVEKSCKNNISLQIKKHNSSNYIKIVYLPNNTTIAEFSDRPFKDSIKTLINNFTYICKIQIDDFIYNTYPICEKQAKLYYDLTEIVELENFGNTCYYMNKDERETI
jgi:hypothetical protein